MRTVRVIQVALVLLLATLAGEAVAQCCGPVCLMDQCFCAGAPAPSIRCDQLDISRFDLFPPPFGYGVYGPPGGCREISVILGSGEVGAGACFGGASPNAEHPERRACSCLGETCVSGPYSSPAPSSAAACAENAIQGCIETQTATWSWSDPACPVCTYGSCNLGL